MAGRKTCTLSHRNGSRQRAQRAAKKKSKRLHFHLCPSPLSIFAIGKAVLFPKWKNTPAALHPLEKPDLNSSVLALN
jgi:hypothetical protein